MKQIDNTINNLEQIKSKSSLKVFLEEYKKMYEQLSEERDYRIRLIENIKQELFTIRKNNLEITKQEEKKRINNRFYAELEKLGYINEEIVCEYENEIDNYIQSLYRKYICEEFGHEYIRHDNGKIEIFERDTGLASAGSPGTPMVICKYCGEKIYKENMLNPDFKDKQKILLPLSELNKECK